MKKWVIAFLSVTFGMVTIAAGEIDEDMVITPKGYGAFEIGQIGHGYYRGGSNTFEEKIHHVWQQRAFGNCGLTAKYKEILEIDIVGEGMMAFSNPQIGDYPETMQPRNFYYMKSSNASIMLGDKSSVAATIQVGYFPYKYNSDVRNLGEYLFRSVPYPMVIYADFDYPEVRLLGLRLNTRFSDRLINNDLILHSETVTHPVQNWSVTDIIESNFLDAITVGGGLCFYHSNLLSVYQGINSTGSVDYYYNLDNLTEEERLKMNIEYSAVKMMVRCAFDLKKIFQIIPVIDIGRFGADDLRLYGELDVLGLKNYDVYYENIKDRMIWTFGLNLPGFKFVDLINAEFEYCENGTAFSDAVFYDSKPTLLPGSLGVDPGSTDGSKLKRSKWRWSTYVKKSLFNEHFSVIAQVARDHKKLNFYYFSKKNMSFQETLPTSKDWWWVFKTEFKF